MALREEKTGHQSRSGAGWGRERSLLTSVLPWFGVGTIGGAGPEVCTLHFDFEKVFRKIIVYRVQFAAWWLVQAAFVDSWRCCVPKARRELIVLLRLISRAAATFDK